MTIRNPLAHFILRVRSVPSQNSANQNSQGFFEPLVFQLLSAFHVAVDVSL